MYAAHSTLNVFRAERIKYAYRNLCEFKNRFIVYFGKYRLCQFARFHTSYSRPSADDTVEVFAESQCECTPSNPARRSIRRQVYFYIQMFFFSAQIRMLTRAVISLWYYQFNNNNKKNTYQNTKLCAA